MLRVISFLFLLVVLSAGLSLAGAAIPPVPPAYPCTAMQTGGLLVLKVQQQACNVYLLTVQDMVGTIHKMFMDGGTVCAIQESSGGTSTVHVVSCESLIHKGIVGDGMLGTFVTSSTFKAGRLSYCLYAAD